MGMIAISTINEVYKGMIIAWDYRFNTLTMVFRLSLFFVFLSLVVGGGRLEQETMAATLLGYIVWFYAAIAISGMSVGLVEEAQSGTLEQMFISPAPTASIVLGRSMSAVVVATSMITVIVGALVLVLGIRVPLRWEALPVFALTMAGLFGFGFVLAGLTLVFKQVNQLGNLSENLLLYLSGAILPLQMLPSALGSVGSVLPTTQGILILRQVTLEARSLTDVWATGDLPMLIVNSCAYLLAGWAVFTVCERIAKAHGTLGQY